MIWKPGLTLEGIKKQALREALTHFKGNKTRTAKALQVSLRWIRNKVREYDLKEFIREEPDMLIIQKIVQSMKDIDNNKSLEQMLIEARNILNESRQMEKRQGERSLGYTETQLSHSQLLPNDTQEVGSRIPYGILKGRELEIALMYFDKELTEKVIGDILGVTESRVCQILSSIKSKITPLIEYRELKEQTFLDDHFCEFRLE